MNVSMSGLETASVAVVTSWTAVAAMGSMYLLKV